MPPLPDPDSAWRRSLAEVFTEPRALLEYLSLDTALSTPARRGAKKFRLRVTREFAERMEKGNPNDPLLRQVLPSECELKDQHGFTRDPLGESSALDAPGMLRKYQGRVLLIATGACAVHCRYCFRRHYPYASQRLSEAHWQQSLRLLAGDRSISEVILSGGDPLMLGDDRLAALVRDLAAIEHLQRLRLHTRLPIVLPARVTAGLVAWLTRSRLKPVVVVHCNHPDELDGQVVSALSRLGRAGIALLNQAVLLRGVNDNADTLCRLSHRLFDAGVLPYYLHLMDRVAGAGHFEVTEEWAMRLYRQLLALLPGYLVPRMVRERRGAASKTPVFPCGFDHDALP